LTPEKALSEAESADVLALAADAATADGVYPLDEHTVLSVKHRGAALGVHLTAWTDDRLIGYAHVDSATGAAELVVAPADRRRGLGAAMLAAAADAGGARFWAHGDLPAAAALAGRAGLTRVRALHQLRRPLTDLPSVPLPADVTLRAFRPGADDAAWLAVNARAFATHPEQGRWTQSDLDARMAEPWFDPAGFLLAVDAADRLVGFHWTKTHPDGLGEVYVLGVDPGGHRRGLGAALTVAGLAHLAAGGRDTVLLYVDESNEAAMRLYERLGFARHATDVMYARP
jgi:mycothiol synthase